MENTEESVHCGTLEFFDVTYEVLTSSLADELYRLRKITFSDRLGWDVICRTGMESDEFDTHGTRYILGVCGGHLVCSVRIALAHCWLQYFYPKSDLFNKAVYELYHRIHHTTF